MTVNLNIAQRISFGFLTIICIMSIATWTANEALKDSKSALERATNIESTKIRDVARMVQNLIALQRSEKNLILSKTATDMDEYSKTILVQDSTLRNLLSTTKGLVTINGAVLLNDFETQYNIFRNTQEQIIALTRDNANVRARRLSQGVGREAYDVAANALNQVITINDLHADTVNNAVFASGSIVRLSARTVQDLLSITRAERNMILAQTQDEMDGYASIITDTRIEMKARREELRELVDDRGKNILDLFSVVWDQFLDVNRQVQELTRENGKNEARTLSQGDARISFDNTLDSLNYLVDRLGLQSAHFRELALLVERNLVSLQRGEKNLILARSDDEMNEYVAAVKISQVALAHNMSLLLNYNSPKDRESFSEFNNIFSAYLDQHNEVLRYSLLNSNVKAFYLASNKGQNLADKSEGLLVQLTDKNNYEHEQLLTHLTQITQNSKLAAEARRLLAEIQRGEKNIILSKTQSEMDSYSSDLLGIRKALEIQLEEMSKFFNVEYTSYYSHTPSQQQLTIQNLTEFNAAFKKYIRLHEEVSTVSRRNSNVQALALSIGVGRVQFDTAQNTLKSLVNMVDDDMAHNLVSANNQLQRAQSITYAIAAIAIIFAVGLAYSIVQSLIRRTRQLTIHAQKLSIGDVLYADDSSSKHVATDELSPVDEALHLIDKSNSQIILMTKALAVGSILPRLTPRSGNDSLIAAINQMADNNTEVAMLANTIASGDLSIKVKVRSEQDQLSTALNRMMTNLRHATESKDRFLSSMTHELRTPLNAIIGLSTALVADTSEISPTKQTEYLGAINNSGQHLLQIIGDILDISKLDASARILENNPFTILELLDVCHKTFNFTCQDKGINLTIDNQFNGAYPVVGDICVLKQILFNLLSNAIKFTDAGSINLTAAPHAASESDPNPGIIFTVTDTGKGINADTIPQLFKPFTQEDDSISRSFGGTGLGLNIAQRLAQLMDGEINCTSSEGHCSTFEVVVYLEQQSKMSEELTADTVEILNLPPLKLLVVDDVGLNLMVANALLTPKGHTIETADSGHQAVDMASRHDYDAILMDIHMPDMSGIEATTIIRNFDNKQRAAVPIIALSADVNVKQQASFIAAGMNATVGKPWRLEDLEKELKHLLNLG